jgi:hypothetical protein
MFLQGLLKVARPAGTVASYKRGDISHATHAHDFYTEHRAVNKTNVNLPRGIHEYIVLNRTTIAHTLSRCADGRAELLIDLETGNNNSLTTDSVISAVSNVVTFKSAASSRTDGFVLAPMVAFGTHKTMATLYDADEDCSSRTAQMNSREEALAPLSGKEIQVHESCYNSSGVSGERLLPDICRKGVELLEDKNVTVSVAVNNAKALLEVMSHALVSSTFNSLCDLYCWEHETRNMNMDQEMKFFHEKCQPMLNQLMVTRDNYAQTASFCQHVPRTSPFFSAPEMRLISHKFRNPMTAKYFQRSKPRWPALMARVNKLNVKRPIMWTGGEMAIQKKSKYKVAVLITQTARNEGIVRRHELGPRVFRARFPLKPPLEKEL